MTDDRWQDTALRFSDPTFAPEWMPTNRPDWPYAATAAFRSWIVARLNELVPPDGSPGHLRADREARLEAEVPAAAQALIDAFARIDMARVSQRYALKTMQMTKGGRKPELDAVERGMLKDAEALASGKKSDGPARDAPLSDERKAVIVAAWDIWLIRRVIIPRFWSEKREQDEYQIPGGGETIKKIVAERYSVLGAGAGKVAQSAWSEYRKRRMAQR